jgi:hypothetical protein
MTEGIEITPIGIIYKSNIEKIRKKIEFFNKKVYYLRIRGS